MNFANFSIVSGVILFAFICIYLLVKTSNYNAKRFCRMQPIFTGVKKLQRNQDNPKPPRKR